MIKISERLKTVASFVLDDGKTANLIDVGCDHALLDIYLLENDENLNLVASDVKEGPLKSARVNLNKYGMLDKIKLSLSDGLSDMEEDTDTIVISGMGSDTIIDILQKGKDKLKSVKKIVISSNGKYQNIRESISLLGFKIEKEKIIFEEGKYYIIIKFIKGKADYSFKELYFGPYLLENKDDIFSDYYLGILKEKNKILSSLPNFNSDKRKIVEDEIKLLNTEIL